MAELIDQTLPKKRGRPPKNKTPAVQPEPVSYEYNTTLGASWTIDTNYSTRMPYRIEDISTYVKAPMVYNEQLRALAWWAYRADGGVASAIEYMRTMHTLNGVVVCQSRTSGGKKPKRYAKNADMMKSTLAKIRYEQFVRDALLKESNDGIIFYYLETTNSLPDSAKFLTDVDVANICDINEMGINASIISLPVDYCRIVGKKNNSYVGAFDMKYFQQWTEPDLARRLKAFPKEIRDAWNTFKESSNSTSWLVLDNRKTIITKINSAMNEPWGVPISIAALDDIMYSDYFTSTKRAVLDEVNNQIIYETFPESEKGRCALTRAQQESQHDTVKGAINTRINSYGRTFFSLAAGTHLDKLDANIEIFDEKNENGIKDAVPSALGVASSSLNGNTKGNYATATLNLELVAGRVFNWIKDIFDELNKCINENIIQDPRCVVNFSVFPTTYVNRDKFFNYMQDLYKNCGGSLQAVIAASGVDVDGYMSLMEYERENEFDLKYPPHQSMFTQSGDAGRPEVDSDNPSSRQTKISGSNDNPKPSVS